MKRKFLYFYFLLQVCAPRIYSQCLQNGDFSQMTCAYDNSCYVLKNGCVSNWYVSHGSPQVFGSNGDATNYALMWNIDPGNGEGMFTNYNFIGNRTYIITLRVSSYASVAETGRFRLYAANNLVDAPICGGGASIPSNSTNQKIFDQAFAANENWTPFTYSFTPTSNFSQFWMYPILPAGGPQYILYVDFVSICPDPCSSVYFNNGQIPLGDQKYNQIFVGSSAGAGGSGAVSVSGTSTTNLIAAQKIELLADFEASVTSGSFSATIADNCEGSISSRKTPFLNKENNTYPLLDHISAELDLSIPNDDNRRRGNETSMYPVPSAGNITIKIAPKTDQQTSLSVTDLSGKEVFNTFNKSNSPLINLDLSNLPNGIYFLKIKTKGGATTKKIIINR